MLNRLRGLSPWPRSVRGRLLGAFSILALSTLTLAIVGWVGLRNTEEAISGFEDRVLPDIARSLELAERTANLAAVAPYVADASAPFQLQGESERLRNRAGNVVALAKRIPELEAAAPAMASLLADLQQTLDELIARTREELFLREDVRQHLFRLDQIDRRTAGAGLADATRARFRSLVDAIVAGASADTAESVERFRRTVRSHLASLEASPPVPVAALRTMALDRGGVFPLREQQLDLQERKAFLLAKLRAISERLSGEVATYVQSLQNRVTHQSESVAHVVASGRTGIALITVICAAAVALGVYMVRRLVGSLKAVTGLMTRLAEGDTEGTTPATDRSDEMGSLARAFEVFRENAVALREQTRMLETVFNNMNDGLSVFDQRGRLVTWNPQYLQILELPAVDIRRGMSLHEVQQRLPAISGESPKADHDVGRFTATRLARPHSFERHYADGRVVEFRSRPMPDGGFVTLYSDLTGRRAVEAQLRQAQKMEVLGQLTGGVAHDFNNLLAAVIGNLQMLQDRLDEPATRRFAERALAAAERGDALTSRLLAFARRQHLRPQRVGTDTLLDGMNDLLSYSVGAGVRLAMHLDSADAPIYVDRGQLENALLNLAINASAAMPDGGELTFSTARNVARESGAAQVRITVRDTGEGIPDVQLDRVFEPFYTTKPFGKGSGLGLSIVYGFVKQSGGDIHMESEPQKGTAVTLVLPLDTENRAAAEQPADAVSADVTAAPDDSLGILVVEDDSQVRAMVTSMLEELGHVVVTASDAEAAEALTAETPFDIVLTDVNLGPGKDGLTLRNHLTECFPGMAVLLTSGLAREHLMERYGLPEDATLLQKPYRRETLVAAIRHARRALE